MTDPKSTEDRINQLKQLDSNAIPEDYGLHLQDWLSHQETENSGCPLLDTPFLIMVQDND